MMRTLSAFRVCCVGMAAGLVLGCEGPKTLRYTVRLPKVGDEARITVQYPAPAGRNASTDLTIRCVKIQGEDVTFRVYYPDLHGLGKVRYNVLVNYSKWVVGSRVWVRNTDGKSVPRGRSVDGVPVPFFHMFILDPNVDTGYVELGGSIAQVIRHTLPSPDRTRWEMKAWCTQTVDHRKQQLMEYERWAEGDWIWYQMDSNVDYDKGAISAFRKQ